MRSLRARSWPSVASHALVSRGLHQAGRTWGRLLQLIDVSVSRRSPPPTAEPVRAEAWLEEQPEVTYLMGANTYRLMSGFAAGELPEGAEEFSAQEEESVGGLTGASKVVFSASLEEPLTWTNCTLVRGDAADAVRAMK